MFGLVDVSTRTILLPFHAQAFFSREFIALNSQKASLLMPNFVLSVLHFQVFANLMDEGLEGFVYNKVVKSAY